MASAKKAAKKVSAKAPAKKTPAKKVSAKAPAKKAPAKKVSAKTPAKKTPAKKVSAKAPAKKAPAKKAPAKLALKKVTKPAAKRATAVKKTSTKANASSKKGSGATFRDWGFRLVVLETLHDLGHFHDEFDRARELAADAEEFTISAPARKILDAIQLTPALLAEITAISLDVGEVQHVLTSEWDGEDDLFEVKRVDDVAFLPNLTTVTVISNIAMGTDLSPIAKVPTLDSFRCTIGEDWAKGLAAFEPLRKRGVKVTLSS
jgi:hypothetical protein